MGAVVEDIGKGGGEPKGSRDVFQGGGVGNTYFLVGDVGDDPPHGPGPGWGFNTGYPYGSLGGILGGYWTVFGSTHLWIWQCRKLGLKRWKHMF